MSRSSLCVPVLLLLASIPAGAQSPPEVPSFPVTPELFLDAFTASEGLTFNAEGDLFIGANSAIWRVGADASVERLTDVYLHLGQAGIGERDILAADFGPSVALRGGPNTDGLIWRITPEGERTVAARGIPDPNFVLVREDGSYLVSDDFADTIYVVEPGGLVRLWSDAVEHPNGLALSPDGSTLYVAQIFTGIAPIGFSDRVWALPLEEGEPAGDPVLVAETGDGGLDGLAMDQQGRVYIADNGGGKVWRFDPDSGDLVLVAEGMPSIASLVFGEGEFDPYSLYGTSTFRGGGRIWRIPVGARGVRQYRPEIQQGVDGSVALPPAMTPQGSISLPNSGAFAQQSAFRSALVLLHAMEYEAAGGAFKAIQREDPSFALAYWGEAMSHLPALTAVADLGPARDALARLEARAANQMAARGTDAERLLIDSLKTLLAEGPRAVRQSEYSARLRAGWDDYPTEPEVGVLLALSLLSSAEPARREEQAVEAAAILEAVLDERAGHPGARHYLVHAYEASGLDALRRRAEALYRRTDPESEHAACGTPSPLGD